MCVRIGPLFQRHLHDALRLTGHMYVSLRNVTGLFFNDTLKRQRHHLDMDGQRDGGRTVSKRFDFFCADAHLLSCSSPFSLASMWSPHLTSQPLSLIGVHSLDACHAS